MEHLLLKAATTATDEGTFTAVISTASVDRDKDIIEPAAMVASLAKWAALGKLVPLAWNHTDEVIGHIDPATATVKNGEVVAAGWVDQSIPRGEEAWRLVKSGTLSFSFGFLFDPKTGATKLPNGRYRVKELDIFEISTVPVGPANNDTRVLSYKSAEELREDSSRHERELLDATLPDVVVVDLDPEPSLEDVQQELAIVKAALAEAEMKLAEPAKSPEELRKDSDRIAREVAEATIPEIEAVPADPEPSEVEKELQEVKALVAEMREGIEDLKKKAEADKEPTEARSVDALRKRSEELALEISSDGMSLRKPPVQVKETPEPIDYEALKRESRDRMFEVLNYSTESDS